MTQRGEKNGKEERLCESLCERRILPQHESGYLQPYSERTEKRPSNGSRGAIGGPVVHFKPPIRVALLHA